MKPKTSLPKDVLAVAQLPTQPPPVYPRGIEPEDEDLVDASSTEKDLPPFDENEDFDELPPPPLTDPGTEEESPMETSIDRHTPFVGSIASPYQQLLTASGKTKKRVGEFRTLQSIESLKKLWMARGLPADDPAFVLIEATVLIQKQNNEVFAANAEMLEKLATMVEDNSKHLEHLNPRLARHSCLIAKFLEHIPTIVDTQTEIAQTSRRIANALSSCVSEISTKSLKSVTFQLFGFGAAMLIGLIIRGWISH